ncbi:hypothetical protein JKP88DRAFT_353013, partial [Tribonema minus]
MDCPEPVNEPLEGQDQVERAMEFGLDVIQQALLEREDTEAFSWFFVHYVKMVGGHYPSMFRSLMQRASRAPTEASFQGARKGLLDALVDAGASDDDVMKYLNDTIYPIRERWAFCYRLGVLTLGINSTQRCEGYFGILKAELLKVTTLCHLKQTLENITARYTSEDHLYMEATVRTAAYDVALEGMDSCLQAIYRNLLLVARQDGTYHCFKSLVSQVRSADRYSVRTCARESVLTVNSDA